VGRHQTEFTDERLDDFNFFRLAPRSGSTISWALGLSFRRCLADEVGLASRRRHTGELTEALGAFLWDEHSGLAQPHYP
jgi:hypothetical protein